MNIALKVVGFVCIRKLGGPQCLRLPTQFFNSNNHWKRLEKFFFFILLSASLLCTHANKVFNLKIYEKHRDLLTNDKVKNILGSRGFFHDVGLITSVLLPLRTAILNLEGTNVNLADCFIQLIKLAVNINKIPYDYQLIGFKNHCIKVINDRLESFEIHPYLLAYFLHPLYRGQHL